MTLTYNRTFSLPEELDQVCFDSGVPREALENLASFSHILSRTGMRSDVDFSENRVSLDYSFSPPTPATDNSEQE